jgi:hypothetical protein
VAEKAVNFRRGTTTRQPLGILPGGPFEQEMTMADLTDEELQGWVESFVVDKGDVGPIASALLELQRHRTARAVDEELARSVVREAIVSLLPTHGGWCYGNTHPATAEVADHIATRAAKQLATAAVRLSDGELRGLQLMRLHLDEGGHDWRAGTAMSDVQSACDMLDRLRSTRSAQ